MPDEIDYSVHTAECQQDREEERAGMQMLVYLACAIAAVAFVVVVTVWS